MRTLIIASIIDYATALLNEGYDLTQLFCIDLGYEELDTLTEVSLQPLLEADSDMGLLDTYNYLVHKEYKCWAPIPIG